MKLRAPAVPLITVDPNFSVWSAADKLTDRDTTHWTGRANLMTGVAEIDGEKYRFMGRGPEPAMEQVSLDIQACSTKYVFAAAGVRLTVTFTSPLLLHDLDMVSRPVSYLALTSESLDYDDHDVSVVLSFSEQFCMNEEGDAPVFVKKYTKGKLKCVRMENASPKILARSGDNLRIEWGALVLASRNAVFSKKVCKDVTFQVRSENEHRPIEEKTADLTFVTATCKLECLSEDVCSLGISPGAVIAIAYDDLGQSLKVWGEPCVSYWNRDGKTIDTAISEALDDYLSVADECWEFSRELHEEALEAGGEKYAELLLLAYRQAIAAHKLVIDKYGEMLYISKECFSNGCAATVDVSYPSIPLFLLYNPELVKALMRPVYRFAKSDKWKYDFAPHDVGHYPVVDFQRYGYDWEKETYRFDKQMPVEECGNMLIMEAAVAVVTLDATFARTHLPLLKKWVKYLIENGADPGDQLCTDDFAGHLAHNTNLAVKAIMGIAAYGLILFMCGKEDDAGKYLEIAAETACSWMKSATDSDGSTRLAFDQPGTFSMKYNAVWDRIFKTDLFPSFIFKCEIADSLKRQLPYGLPLDSRKTYTKSDWLVWTATLAEDKEDFEKFVERLWEAYHRSPSRVPMTDWYWTDTSEMVEFQARSVQGGLFMKLLASRLRK